MTILLLSKCHSAQPLNLSPIAGILGIIQTIWPDPFTRRIKRCRIPPIYRRKWGPPRSSRAAVSRPVHTRNSPSPTAPDISASTIPARSRSCTALPPTWGSRNSITRRPPIMSPSKPATAQCCRWSTTVSAISGPGIKRFTSRSCAVFCAPVIKSSCASATGAWVHPACASRPSVKTASNSRYWSMRSRPITMWNYPSSRKSGSFPARR